MRGRAEPQDDFLRERSIVPAGCAARSRMTIPKSEIRGRQLMLPSNCLKSSNSPHRKTFPDRDQHCCRPWSRSVFLTTCLPQSGPGARIPTLRPFFRKNADFGGSLRQKLYFSFTSTQIVAQKIWGNQRKMQDGGEIYSPSKFVLTQIVTQTGNYTKIRRPQIRVVTISAD